jgi:hypothetical protein
VADYSSGLHIIDVANPESSFEVGFCSVLGFAYGVAVSGDYAYLAGDYGLRIFNVANPQDPHEAGFYDTPDEANGVAVLGNNAYVADWDAGLQIIEFLGAGIEEGSTPHASRTTPIPTIVRGVLEVGSRLTAYGSRPEIELYDANGRKVMELHLGPNDVSRFGAGVYFVRDLGSGGRGRGEVRKVVIAK